MITYTTQNPLTYVKWCFCADGSPLPVRVEYVRKNGTKTAFYNSKAEELMKIHNIERM